MTPSGFPAHPHRQGRGRDFYRFLTANFRREDGEPLNRCFDGDTMILEENVTGTVIGEMLGIPERPESHLPHRR